MSILFSSLCGLNNFAVEDDKEKDNSRKVRWGSFFFLEYLVLWCIYVQQFLFSEKREIKFYLKTSNDNRIYLWKSRKTPHRIKVPATRIQPTRTSLSYTISKWSNHNCKMLRKKWWKLAWYEEIHEKIQWLTHRQRIADQALIALQNNQCIVIGRCRNKPSHPNEVDI